MHQPYCLRTVRRYGRVKRRAAFSPHRRRCLLDRALASYSPSSLVAPPPGAQWTILVPLPVCPDQNSGRARCQPDAGGDSDKQWSRLAHWVVMGGGGGGGAHWSDERFSPAGPLSNLALGAEACSAKGGRGPRHPRRASTHVPCRRWLDMDDTNRARLREASALRV